jgi:hypothetical protein
LSGVHPGAEGLIHWTLFRCGHMRAEVVLEEDSAPALEELLVEELPVV